MARKPPVDLWTEKEREVASILLDVSSIMSQEPIQWGRKRRRTEPSYQFKPEPERLEPELELPSSSNEDKRKHEETPTTTTSPVTPLCFPNSGSEEIQEKIVQTPPPLKQIKKSNCQRERLKEKREKVAALTKENADLIRELKQLQQRFCQLNAEKLQLQDKNFKLCAAQVGVGDLNQLKAVGPTQLTNWSPFVVTQQWAPPPPPPPLYQPAIERPGLGLDLNVKLADDVVRGCRDGGADVSV